MQVVVQDLLTNYDRQGSGKVILLLHGWADRLETFNQLLPNLSAEYTVISLDLPGFGKTTPPKTVWNLDNYAQFVQDFLQKLEIKRIYAVVGHSNGGALAIRAVSLGHIEPEKLVLLAASGVRDTAQIRRFALKIVAKFGKVATFWLPNATRKKLQKKLYGTVGSDMLVAPHLQETFKLTVKQDIQRDAAKLQIPTLLIYGDDDRATPLADVGMILHRKIQGSNLVTIPGADHFVHRTGKDQVLKSMKEFLA